MKDEEVKRDIMTLAKFKPNPNHYIIVDKWNKKEYNKVKFKIFDILEREIDKVIASYSAEYFAEFAEFASFPSIIEESTDFWELYKKQLPLWSNININCYVKLKEN